MSLHEKGQGCFLFGFPPKHREGFGHRSVTTHCICSDYNRPCDYVTLKATASTAFQIHQVLKTSGGFHTSLMEPAKQRLAKAG